METSKIKTSESLIVVGGLILFITLTAFIPASWFGIHPVVYKNKPLDLSAIYAASEFAKDANGDGSISWNEVISQTFKNSSSTEDSIKNTPIDKKSIAQLNDPNNLTGSFSKNLYLSSVYLNDKGITDAESQQTALNNLISQEASKITPTTYTYKDINVARREDKASMKAYGNSIAPILQEVVTKKIITDDFASINSFTQTKDESDLSDIKKNRTRVDGLLQKLLSVSVPPSAISYHILALDRIAIYRDTLDNLSKASTDPVRAKLAIEQYVKMMVLILQTPSQFSKYFDMQNIVFSSKDPGYVFTIGYNINN